MSNSIALPLARPGTAWRLAAALAAVYVIWGSTYFAIGQAVRTIPPFSMAASRFAIAGALLYVLRRAAGTPKPTSVEWRAAAIVGGFLILGGNGLVSWAEQKVPSGLTALIVSLTPLAMVSIDWARPGGVRPSATVIGGLALGFTGMVLLVGPARLAAAKDADLFSTIVCVLAPCLWAAGSVYSRQAPHSTDVLLTSSMQMLTGSLWLAAAALFTGEPHIFEWAAISRASAMAWLYLTLIGSLIGFTAYVYLLKNTTPAIATTYAYVNPVVAVILGWGLGGEVITSQFIVAGGLLLAGVVLITAFRNRAA